MARSLLRLFALSDVLNRPNDPLWNAFRLKRATIDERPEQRPVLSFQLHLSRVSLAASKHSIGVVLETGPPFRAAIYEGSLPARIRTSLSLSVTRAPTRRNGLRAGPPPLPRAE